MITAARSVFATVQLDYAKYDKILTIVLYRG